MKAYGHNHSQLPQDWRVVDLKKICIKPQYGFTASAADQGNTKFLRITDIKNLSIDWSHVPYCNCEQDALNKYKITDNDILFARIGATTGKSCIVKSPPSAVFASYLIRIRAKENVDPGFLFFFFQTNDYWKQIDANKNNNLKKGVNASVLETLSIPLPPSKVEQRRIAAILSAVQRAIEQQERLIALTNELKKALMHKLFTEGTRGEPQKQTEIGMIPKSWALSPLSEILSERLQNGAFIKKPNKGKGFLFANVIDMYKDVYLDSTELERISVTKSEIERYLLLQGDILLVRSSLKREGVGQNCIVKYVDEPIFFDCHLIRVRPDTEKILPEFLSYFWQSSTGKNDLVNRSKTTTMTTINQLAVSSALIPIPAYSEQREIVSLFLNIDRKIRNHKKIRQHVDDLFRTLLHQLMTAQIRVNDIDLSELGIEAEAT